MLSIVKLSAIRLYLANPRYSESLNEQEELCKVVEDQKKKLVRLAEDIASNGLSELDVIAVFPDKEPNCYCVAEGNRRITALKLLQNQEIIKDTFPSIYSEFKKISISNELDFDRINVSIFPSEEDPKLKHFLEVRHLGEQGGVGTVKWDAKQIARFNFHAYGKENLVVFLDKLESEGFLTSDQIAGVTKTNWDRILRPVGLNFLKLTKIHNTYSFLPEDQAEFIEKIRMVADALNGETVSIVYDQKDIEKFFRRMEEKYAAAHGNSVGVQEHEPNVKDDSTEHGSTESNGHDAGGNPGPANAPNPKMPPDPYKNCRTVIPSVERLQSRNHRITLMINELKKLEVEQYPNACGCLLRALIELSAKEYLEYNNATGKPNNDATSIEFQDAIAAASSHMVASGALSKDEARALRQDTDTGGIRQLFNGYMHNTDSYPSPVVIKAIFLTYLRFLKLCML